jgi:hypothetical protein
MEGKKWDLKAGEFGDFIVLSNDLTKVEPRESTSTRKSCLPPLVGGPYTEKPGKTRRSLSTWVPQKPI